MEKNYKDYKEYIAAKNLVDNYTPCRISECFLDCDGVIEITNYTGVFKLRGVGRQVWLMSDGSNTIADIVDNICKTYELTDRKEIRVQVIKLIKELNRRKALIVNWDPLFKFEISQVLTYEE